MRLSLRTFVVRNFVIFAVGLASFSTAQTCMAQVPKFQALYLLNFSRNLDWNQSNVTIGVLGNSKTFGELESLVAKYPNISLQKLAPGEPLSSCQMVFLPVSQNKNFDAVQQKIGSSPIVLVAEDSDLASKGAEIAFFMEGNKLKFSINKGALDASGVKVNDKLLSIAKVVN